MAIKVFCDVCGKPMAEDKALYFDFGGASMRELLLRIDNDVCKYCIIDAVKKLDDRPKAKMPFVPMLPRLATIEMVSSVDRSKWYSAPTNEDLQRMWMEMYDAAINAPRS